MRRIRTRKQRAGYSPIGINGGNQGVQITTYPEQGGAWKLPDPMAAAGVPYGKQI
jgi:hypothetical protein